MRESNTSFSLIWFAGSANRSKYLQPFVARPSKTESPSWLNEFPVLFRGPCPPAGCHSEYAAQSNVKWSEQSHVWQFVQRFHGSDGPVIQLLLL